MTASNALDAVAELVVAKLRTEGPLWQAEIDALRQETAALIEQQATALRAARDQVQRLEGERDEARQLNASYLTTPVGQHIARAEAAEAKAARLEEEGPDNPVWLSGNGAGVEGVVQIVNTILDGRGSAGGVYGSATLQALRERLASARDREAQARRETWANAIAEQPTTAMNPNESAYQRGRFDAAMEYVAALRDRSRQLSEGGTA